MGVLFLSVSAVLSCAGILPKSPHDRILYDFELSIYSVSGDKMRPEFEWTSIQQDNPLDPRAGRAGAKHSRITKLIRQLSTDVLLTDVYDGDESLVYLCFRRSQRVGGCHGKSVIQGKVSMKSFDGDKIILNKKPITGLRNGRSAADFHADRGRRQT